MHRDRRMGRALGGLAGLAALALAGCSDNGFTCAPGTPVTVDYGNQGTFRTASLGVAGVTVTGSDSVNVLNLNGLGIVGGSFDNDVDGTEWIHFAFSAPAAAAVSYHVLAAGNLNRDSVVGAAVLEAFDRTGRSLGTHAVDGAGPIDVSTLFGNTPISAFTATANVDNFRIDQLTYSACGGGSMMP